MKFVALFALCYLAGAALADREDVPHSEAVDAAHGRLSHLNLELPEDHKPVVHTRAPFEDLDLSAPRLPETRDARPDNTHVGAEHENASEAAPTSTGLPVVEVTSTAAPAEMSTSSTDTPVTSDDHTNDSSSEKPTTEANTDSSNTDSTSESSNTDSTSDSSNTDATSDSSNTNTPTESGNTDTTPTSGDATESTGTDSSNTEPNTEPTGEAGGEQGQKPKGLSTASISAIVIGGVLAVAVVVAVAMAIVRRRRMEPERRGILDA